MKQIINGKLYDTEKSEILCVYTCALSICEDTWLFKTAKGNYFEVHVSTITNRVKRVSVHTKKQVICFLEASNEYETLQKHFGYNLLEG